MSIIIDGTTFDVPVLRPISRSAAFLDKFAERTDDGELHRELIGVFLNYQIKFGTASSPAEYALLWAKLTEPTEFHEVTVPDDGGGSFTFTAYFSNVADEIHSATLRRGLTVNFIARSPARIP